MFNVGDTVKLTGTHWDYFDLKDAEVTVTGISLQRDPQFTTPSGREYVIFTDSNVDYSATLVRAAEVTTHTQTDRTVEMLRVYIGNLRYNLETGIPNSQAAFHKGRLEAFEDALQMLTGNRSEGDIK